MTGKKAVEAVRTPGGRFAKGNSIGYKGRPAGAVSELLKMSRAAALELLPDIIERARGGESDALRIVFSLGAPKLKATAEPVELPAGVDGILEAMHAGRLDAQTAQEAISAHAAAARVREMEELERRLAAVEKKLAEK